MKYIITTLIIFCLTSCSGKSYSYLADPIFKSYGKEMKKKRNYFLSGTGGSMPNDDVKSLFMSFLGNQDVSISEARRLYIEVVEGLISRVNYNEKIKPFLHDYPVTYKNMNIHLSFDFRKVSLKNDPVDFICLVNNTIYYSIYNLKTRQYEKIYTEPYEVALKIVQDEQNVLSTQNTLNSNTHSNL